MVYAIFTRERGRATGERVMHAVPVREDARETVCGLPIGRGSGLVRDGDYHGNRPCPRCWPSARASRGSA